MIRTSFFLKCFSEFKLGVHPCLEKLDHGAVEGQTVQDLEGFHEMKELKEE